MERQYRGDVRHGGREVEIREEPKALADDFDFYVGIDGSGAKKRLGFGMMDRWRHLFR